MRFSDDRWSSLRWFGGVRTGEDAQKKKRFCNSRSAFVRMDLPVDDDGGADIDVVVDFSDGVIRGVDTAVRAVAAEDVSAEAGTP